MLLEYRLQPTLPPWHVLYNQGYVLCLLCGSADFTLADERPPSTLVADIEKQSHLHGSRLNDREKLCPGNYEASWAIQHGVLLSVVTHTKPFELQLHDANSKFID
jgi:hypothetical protein